MRESWEVFEVKPIGDVSDFRLTVGNQKLSSNKSATAKDVRHGEAWIDIGNLT